MGSRPCLYTTWESRCVETEQLVPGCAPRVAFPPGKGAVQCRRGDMCDRTTLQDGPFLVRHSRARA